MKITTGATPSPGTGLRENVVQGIARELLVNAIIRLEERGFPVIFTVHDEIVVEHPQITRPIMEEIMSEPPQWAVDLGVPLSFEGWAEKRYRK
ncbi:MAG: hypothetical protein J2P48_01205 [Alphaproteobacteria bacterium]|nr:hypothetical protein [Alphaproteobacteria bacterium]